jgi:tetratricopeptide (TPR) repeat protein
MTLTTDDKRMSLCEMGVSLYLREQFEEAIPYFEQSLRMMDDDMCKSDASNSARAHYWLAECYYHMKDYDMALTQYNASIQGDSSNFQAYFDRGYLYQKLNAIDLAIEDFTRSIQLNMNFASSFHNRGIGFKQKRMLDDALKDLRRALEIGSKNGNHQPKTIKALYDILLPRALRFTHAGRFDEALAIYDECLMYETDHMKVLMDRASLYVELNQWENVIDDYTLILDQQPRSLEALRGRAQANKELKRWNQAAKDYQALLFAVPLRSASQKVSIIREIQFCIEQLGDIRLIASILDTFSSADSTYADEDYRST